MPWVLYLFIHIGSNIHISLYYYRLLRMQTKLRTTCSQGNLGEKENLLAKVSWFLQGKFLQRQHKEILISHHYNEISFFISFFNIRPKFPHSFIWILRTFAYSQKRFVNTKATHLRRKYFYFKPCVLNANSNKNVYPVLLET